MANSRSRPGTAATPNSPAADWPGAVLMPSMVKAWRASSGLTAHGAGAERGFSSTAPKPAAGAAAQSPINGRAGERETREGAERGLRGEHGARSYSSVRDGRHRSRLGPLRGRIDFSAAKSVHSLSPLAGRGPG